MSEQVPEADATSSKNVPSKSEARISLSGILAIIICGVYFLLAFSLLSGTTLTLFVFMGIWSVSFLVLYIGIPLAFIVWAIIMVYRFFIQKNKQLVIWTGTKYGVIVFGIMGIVFGLWGLIPPTAKTFTLGYWIHAKVWVDVEEVRVWIKENQISKDPNINVPLAEWPSSLKMIPLAYGRLNYDQQKSTVTLVEGGGFGHWGLTVAPKETPIPKGWCVLKLEDGAWV